MAKGKLLAFLKDECQIPRNAALSYLCLPKALGADRQMIEESGTDVGAILRIAKAPQLVRAEAITMLRSGRSLSNINLRHLLPGGRHLAPRFNDPFLSPPAC